MSDYHRAPDWVKAGAFSRADGDRRNYHRTHRKVGGSREERDTGTVLVTFLSPVIGVPFPDGSQACYERGDRAKIPAHLVERLQRRGHILTLEG